MATRFSERVGAEIVRCLRDSGRTQGDLCKALGWSDPYLSRRIVGRVSFSLDDIEAIAAALDVPRRQLLDAPIPQIRNAG